MNDGRLFALKKLLSEGRNSTQEELRLSLELQGFTANQSTISRDLRKIGALKAISPEGKTIYRMPGHDIDQFPLRSSQSLSIAQQIVSIKHNGAMIVIKTTPGSALLIATHLDRLEQNDILGTIAGDDTVFVALGNVSNINNTIHGIEGLFQ